MAESQSGEPRRPPTIEELEELDDAEASPALPAASLARAAAPHAVAAPAVRHDSYGEIWSLSWPVMLSQVLVALVALIDIAMVGRLGADAVAAVGYAAQFYFLVQSTLFSVGAACVALVARAIGAGDRERARHALAASLIVALVAAALLAGAILAAPRSVLRLLGAEAAVIDAAIPYLVLLIGSSLPLAVAMTLESGLRADKDTRTPMQIAFAVMVVKIAANAVLIFGALGFPRLELVGAGIATALSQAVGVALFAVVWWRAPAASPLAIDASHFRACGARVREIVRITLPGLGERLAMNLALLAYFRVLSEYGAVAIAAYTVGIRVLAFSWIPGIGFGAAAATLVGQALGAGQERAAERAGWRALRMALGVALAVGVPCALARTPLARLFTNDPGIVETLGPFLLVLAASQPFLQAHFALGGAHRGAGDTMTPFVAATLGNWALRVPLAWLFAFALRLDVVWVWGALWFDHVTRTAWLAWSFRRGRWRHRLGA